MCEGGSDINFFEKIEYYENELQRYCEDFSFKLSQIYEGKKGNIQTFELKLGEDLILTYEYKIKDNFLNVFFLETSNNGERDIRRTSKKNKNKKCLKIFNSGNN